MQGRRVNEQKTGVAVRAAKVVMDAGSRRQPGAFSPLPTTPTSPTASFAQPHHQRSPSTGSDSSTSTSSHPTAMSTNKRQYPQRPPLVSGGTSNSSLSSSSTTSHNFSRPSIAQIVSDVPPRKNSPLNPSNDPRSHKRNNSQGFFDPSVSVSTVGSHLDPGNAMSGLSASQIAAQAAMGGQQGGMQHSRKRSQTVPSPQNQEGGQPGVARQRTPQLPPVQTGQDGRRPSAQGMAPPQFPRSGTNSPTLAATSAANAAYPGLPQLSPGLSSFSEFPTEREGKQKSDRKLKLFSSRPKHIAVPSYKDTKERPLPSPVNKISSPPAIMSAKMNASSTSLADSISTVGQGSIYGMANSSTSTLVPADRVKNEDKEKHKHHFLSRQKHKLKDKIDDYSQLNLSSAASNSKPSEPNAPSLYNFTPSSPAPSQSAFSKSTTGFDLRHGGRALREKKKEEKAASQPASRGGEEWPFGPPSTGSSTGLLGGDLAQATLHGLGLSNMTAEEAWDFLKAKLLIIFEGEEVRMPVEDLNKLVFSHVQRCIQRRAPAIIIEDLDDLLLTGFTSLDMTLGGIPDEKLVPFLVEMWLFVFGTVLPYIQAVFLPLDLELKGHGPLLTPTQATDFWGIDQDTVDPSSELDVRRFVLLSFRDHVILQRHDTLKTLFSRLSLESINAGVESPLPLPSPSAFADPPTKRPGTSGSLDPSQASFNSQGSTLLGDGARSRATSNTSAPELPPFSPSKRPPKPLDSEQVTEMGGRMLQCMSVLCSLRSGDESQDKVEDLTKALKLNWLGRGRTGRNRKGFVGAKVPRRVGVH